MDSLYLLPRGISPLCALPSQELLSLVGCQTPDPLSGSGQVIELWFFTVCERVRFRLQDGLFASPPVSTLWQVPHVNPMITVLERPTHFPLPLNDYLSCKTVL